MTQTRRDTGMVRRVHVSSMPWWIYGANVRLDAAANTVVNEAYASGQGTATLPDGSVADLHAFSLTRTTLFEHRDPGGGWSPYDAQCTAAIAAAMGNYPNGGAVNLPGGIPFEVRWGTQATSAKMPTPPPEGIIQVNPKNQNTRVVRRAGGGATFAVPFSKAPDFIAGAAKSTTTANANPQREGHALCGSQPVCRRGGRSDDSARTRRKILISTQATHLAPESSATATTASARPTATRSCGSAWKRCSRKGRIARPASSVLVAMPKRSRSSKR